MPAWVLLGYGLLLGAGGAGLAIDDNWNAAWRGLGFVACVIAVACLAAVPASRGRSRPPRPAGEPARTPGAPSTPAAPPVPVAAPSAEPALRIELADRLAALSLELTRAEQRLADANARAEAARLEAASIDERIRALRGEMAGLSAQQARPGGRDA